MVIVAVKLPAVLVVTTEGDVIRVEESNFAVTVLLGL
jgi:hypothetical protein